MPLHNLHVKLGNLRMLWGDSRGLQYFSNNGKKGTITWKLDIRCYIYVFLALWDYHFCHILVISNIVQLWLFISYWRKIGPSPSFKITTCLSCVGGYADRIAYVKYDYHEIEIWILVLNIRFSLSISWLHRFSIKNI